MSKDNTAIEEFKGDSTDLATADVASSRAIAEVQAAMVIAQRFPRDETAAYERIIKACKRRGLAEAAMYAYPRGGSVITGPSIRLAETMARAWGNLEFGIAELEQRNGESTMQAYCWDLETNTRQVKMFTVKHERKARGAIMRLEDPRDIYEMNANMGARRLRACILGIIPGDIVEDAVSQCEQTMKGSSKEPLIDRVRKLVVAFADLSVTKGQIERRLGHTVETTIEAEFVSLRKIYLSLRDGMSKQRDWFEPEVRRGTNGSSKPKDLDDLTNAMTNEKPKAEPVDDGAPTPEELAADEKEMAEEDGRHFELETQKDSTKSTKKGK